MAQDFNVDNLNKVKSTVENLKAGAFPRLPRALEVVKEQSEQSGSPALIASCTGAMEGAEAMLKLFNEFIEKLDEYTARQTQIFRAAGFDV